MSPSAVPVRRSGNSTQRKAPRERDDEERLTADLIELARQYARVLADWIRGIGLDRQRQAGRAYTAIGIPAA